MTNAVKTDEAPKVTEAEVKASNQAEEAKWSDDFKAEELAVPYKREDAKDDKAEKKEAPKATNTPKEDEDEVKETPAPVQYTEPESVTVDDPGEYKPADYSFEVTLADGKTKTIRTPEDADKIAEDAENFENPKQLLDFIRKSQKLEAQLSKDKESYDKKKEDFEKQSKAESERQETITNMTAEFKYLIGKGLLPKIDAQFINADWSDPEVAKQPGVKEQIDLLDYMVKENKIRAKARVKKIDSVVDAFNAWSVDRERKQADKDNRDAGEARKAAGARVAGVSPSQQGSFVPKGIAVGNPNVFKRSVALWDN